MIQNTLQTELCSPSALPVEKVFESGTLKTIAQSLETCEWLAGHNVAGDITMLAEAGIPIRESWAKGTRILDSLLLARMRDENATSYKLEDVAGRTLGIPAWKAETEVYNWIKYRNKNNRLCRKKDVDARRWPVDARRRRCATDAWAARLLVEHDYDRSKRQVIEYTHRTAMTLERLHIAGAIVDLEKLNALDVEYRLAREQARGQLVAVAASVGCVGFVPSNDGHIRDLLFNRLGLRSVGKTPTGKQRVDKDTLKELDHDATKLLLDYNHYDKRYNVNILGSRTYSRSIPNTQRAYLPFRINPLGARTGRRSSSKPNAQNWPEDMHGVVCSRWQEGLILNADYKKLEVVLIAWIAGDGKLLEYFTKGKGYVDVAKELFGYDVEPGTDAYTAVKSIVLGVHYNMQGLRMARELALLGIRFSTDWSQHEVETERLRRLYLRRFGGIGRYMRRRESMWRATQESSSLVGRVRHLPVRPGTSRAEQAHLLNQAINFPIQSLAADVTASALMDIESAFMAEAGLGYSEYLSALTEQRKNVLTKGLDCGILLPMSQIFNEVHDSLVVDLNPDRLKQDTEIIVETMRAVPSLRALAPGFDHRILGVDVKTSSHWRSK